MSDKIDILDDFLVANYDYNLPPESIAQSPLIPRESAKLLVYDRKKDKIEHSDFYHFSDFLPQDSLIILNDTKVIKARIYGQKESGGKIELLYHKEISPNKFLVQIKGRVKIGDILKFDSHMNAKILELKDGGFRVVEFYQNSILLDIAKVLAYLENHGLMPLPPYIKKYESPELYQSVFASKIGAVAAPTASLHFSNLDTLKSKFHTEFVTLHVGAGTFLSVEVDDLREHRIHTEIFDIPKSTQNALNLAKANAQNILCVGTTALRCVEYYHATKISSGACDIFLHPGHPPSLANSLLTNFHLPKTTLLMLVASLIGRQKALEIYQIAIKNNYRFYSFGDGMLII